MRNASLLILAALVLFAAGCSAENVPSPAEASQTEAITSLQTETTLPAVPESKESAPAETPEPVLFYSEIDSKFGPGPFSVNDLISIFGEPKQLYGRVYSHSSGDVCLYAEFDGVSFKLIPEAGEVSFDYETLSEDDNAEHSVTEQDKAIKIKLEPYPKKLTKNQTTEPAKLTEAKLQFPRS